MTATAALSLFITQTRFDQIPVEAIKQAKDGILDSAGLCLAGSALPAGSLLVQYVRTLGGVAQAVVVGHGFRAPAPHAAWVNGTLISSLNWADSSFLGDVWHPTPVMWPALFALAEQHRLSGRRLLEAYVTGFEVGARIAMAWQGHYALGWLGTATIGTLASTAAASRLLDLTEPQTRMAIGIACDSVSGTKQSMGAMHAQSAGKAARDGVIAASLARIGYTADANGLDGPESISALVTGNRFDASRLSAGLGTDYYLLHPGGLSLKYYPTGHLSHWCIDATLDLVREHGINAVDVEEVVCVMPDWFVDTLRHHEPRSALEAKISIEYPVAAALLFHKVDAAIMTDEHVQSPEVQRLMRRVRTVRLPVDAGGHAAGDDPNTVIVRLRDGRAFSRTVSSPKGSSRNPFTESELWTKFSDCAATVLSPSKTTEAFERLQRLDALDEVSGLASVLMG